MGPRAVRDDLSPSDREVFDRAYTATYGPAREIVTEIYDEVTDATELRPGRTPARGATGSTRAACRTVHRWGLRRHHGRPDQRPADKGLVRAFVSHPAHEALAAAAKLRPSVDISVA
ncbi:hypothetical protein AB0O75_06910 [Streptomyces sp. NPDC088921]|uniref:hypothetical protein n=1 Tax=unclassified Streptomyces TaxID=2593676 RepID=UPI0034349B21